MNKHILIIRLSSFGDVAMTVPVISVFRKKYPSAKITILTTVFCSELFNQIPNINFLFFENKHKNILGLFSITSEITKLKVDYIIDLHNVLRTNIIKALINPFNLFKTPFFKIDKGRMEKKRIIYGSRRKKLKSMHQRYADVFSSLEMTLDLKQFKPYRKLEIRNKNYSFLNSKKMIGIAPFAKHSCKEYSMENISKIINLISDKFCVILFGAPGDEQSILDKVAKQKDNVYSIAGKVVLSEQMAIMSNLALMVSMDSANGHIASLFGINVISIWGATHPCLGYAAFGQSEQNSITPSLEKYPRIPVSIYGAKCPNEYIDSINDIKVEEVIKRIKQLI